MTPVSVRECSFSFGQIRSTVIVFHQLQSGAVSEAEGSTRVSASLWDSEVGRDGFLIHGQESLNSLYRIGAGDQMVMEKLKEN